MFGLSSLKINGLTLLFLNFFFFLFNQKNLIKISLLRVCCTKIGGNNDKLKRLVNY